MYFLLNMGIFHCYVSLPEGTLAQNLQAFSEVTLNYTLGWGPFLRMQSKTTRMTLLGSGITNETDSFATIVGKGDNPNYTYLHPKSGATIQKYFSS